MAKDPSFPFYASDYLGSSAHTLMTTEQRSAYVDLLCHQWMNADCSLPDDEEELAALSGIGEGWLKGGSKVVRRWFPEHPNQAGRIANTRLLEVRAERDEWIAKSRVGGQKSGETRRRKAKQRKKIEPTANQTRTKGQPKGNTPSSFPSSSSSSFASSSPSSSSGNNAPSSKLDLVVAHYKTFHPQARPGDKECRLIAARLTDGFDVEALELAIDGCHRSPHNCGENERGRKYQSLELIMRDSTHVLRFLETPQAGDEPVLSEKTKRSLRAAEAFLARHGVQEDDHGA